MPGNAAGNIVEGGMKGNWPAPGMYGGKPAPAGGKNCGCGGIVLKNGIIGGMNGIRPAVYAGCIGMNGDRHGIGGMPDEEVAAPLIIICGSNGGGKKNGFGNEANWAADGTDVAAAAGPALAAAAAAAVVLVDVDDESASDEDSLVGGFSFSPYNNHTEKTLDIS